MTVLKQGSAKYPFWGSSIKLIGGLDPLSLQTTSEATYAYLLPGISNLTNRLRYFGFYCWLLDFYFQRQKKGNSNEQYKFIRRAELMIAIIMRSERKSVTQITGSDFADDLINNRTGRIFNIAAGADKTVANEDVYWKYPSGAFGQYYYGAMRGISLIVAAANDDGDVIYRVTQPHSSQRVSGKELADAFDGNLTTSIKDLFYDNIISGKLNFNDIAELIKYFSIDSITPKSKEWSLYVNMLLDKDDPSQEVEEKFTYHRKETIISLINTTLEKKGEYDWYNLLLKAYTLKLEGSDTLKGWYAYQLNEYFQFGCGTIFWGTLMHLYKFQQDQYLPSFLKKFSKLIVTGICKNLNRAKQDSELKFVLSLISSKLNVERIGNEIETKPESNPVIATVNGFMLIFKLYIENKDQLHSLKEFMTRNQLLREGNMIDGLLYLHNCETDTLAEFIEQYLQRKIINRHQMVAIRKMGNGSVSTQKFIVEDQYIKFIDTFPPRRTSPRMKALQNLLTDLSIVDDQNNLTANHIKLLAGA